MTDTNSEDEKSGACRSCTARLEAHHRLTLERHNHDTLRRVCCGFAVRQSFESGVFQGANRLPRCIVAKSPRGCAGKLGGGKRCRADERPSGAEEVIEGHFGLNNAGMRVAQETHRRHQCQMNRRPRSRQLLEGPGIPKGQTTQSPPIQYHFSLHPIYCALSRRHSAKCRSPAAHLAPRLQDISLSVLKRAPRRHHPRRRPRRIPPAARGGHASPKLARGVRHPAPTHSPPMRSPSPPPPAERFIRRLRWRDHFAASILAIRSFAQTIASSTDRRTGTSPTILASASA